jgi:hypothetical protein
VKFAPIRARGDLARIPQSELFACPALVRLAGLDVTDTIEDYRGSRDRSMAALLETGHLRGLVALALHGPSGDVAAQRSLLAADRLPNLRELALHNGLGGELLVALVADEGFRRIVRLKLDYVGLGADRVQALADSPNVTGLRSLTITPSYPRLGPDGARALAGSPHLSGLTALSLCEQSIEVAGVEALATSPHLAGLRYLHLHERRFTPEMVRPLLRPDALPGLLCLDLRGNRLPAAVVKQLRARFPGGAVMV